MKKLLVFLLALFAFLYFIPSLYPVYAACPTAADPNFGPDAAGLCEIQEMVGNVISVVVGLGFIALLVMLIFAGIKYLTSGGEPKAIQAAHQTVTWALLGMVFMIIAWLVLQLISSVTGLELTVFNIKALCKLNNDLLAFCKVP